jgi:hypothetical protein
MGLSFDIHVYDLRKLGESLTNAYHVEEGQLRPLELLEKVRPLFGVTFDSKIFVMQNVEYWEDYSPWSEFIDLFDRYYGSDEGYAALLAAEVLWHYTGANADEVAEEIGIELPEAED